MAKPDCYACVHRADIPGDCHSACKHPDASLTDFIRNRPTALNIACHAHGFNNGWFMWPLNFDPVWLIACDGFTPKEIKNVPA